VLNWNILRDNKVKLTKCQNHQHNGGVFDTWTKWVKPQTERAQGPAGRPNSLVSRPCFMSVWPAALRIRVYTRSRRPRRWRKSVDTAPPGRPATWLGRSATTWYQTNFSKSVELPHGPINTPLRWKWEDAPYFGDSTSKTLILSVVARRSLVRTVVRFWGLEGLPACWEPSS
jgi:hypothetical protein